MTDLLNTTVRATHRMSLIATALIAVAFGVAASPNMAAAGQGSMAECGR
jgi:sulfite exporter TauE/SafE